ncbi:MAG: type II toxin-antitoxin system VapC family toxin [Pseudomonadota bacterium]|nr:type II toxin-antitoxin system VapC family toxin [Pseudomonadota bacterium]
MKLLIDTCAFIWLATAPRKLSKGMRLLYENPGNEVYLSVASAWEISIKHRSGKLRLSNDMPPAEFIPEARRRHGIEVLALREEDSFMLPRLPPIHQDPFDRMLICQAIANQMVILTPDPLITQYPVLTRW